MLLAVSRGHNHAPGPPPSDSRCGDCIADFFAGATCTKHREIRANESTLPVDHVALRASPFAKENRSAFAGISGKPRVIGFALESAYITDERFSRAVVQAAKTRHASARNSTPNYSRQSHIRSPLNRGTRGDVRCSLATSTIQTMTPCASALKNSPSF